ncbi:MAG TPA: ATP-binding protein [Oligoflexia bacterium]|nr:ATP-binding protein [Oligoflexia bacterium]
MSLDATEFLESCSEIFSLVNNSRPDCDVAEAVCQLAVKLEGVRSVSVFLYVRNRTQSHEISKAAHFGDADIPPPVVVKGRSASWPAINTASATQAAVRYFRFVILGKTGGWLGAACDPEICRMTELGLELLALLTGVAYEKPQASASLRHLLGKIEMHNELNKLIISGSNLERISRTIAREVAFRFGSACALVALISEAEKQLELTGSYGCPPDSLPAKVEILDNQVGRSLQFGGIISVPDLRAKHDHGLDFLVELGFSCVHWASIDLRGESLGVVLIGFRERKELNELDGDMLEEFARSTAAAILNARNKDKLANYASILEDLVEDRTKDLAVQKARADQANQAKSKFVANMSHELRSPLTAIFGYSNVMADGIFGPVSDEQREALRAIVRAADHLKELINDVLDISKVEAGSEDTDPAKVELVQLVQQVHKLMLQTAMGKEVHLLPLDVQSSDENQELTAWVDPRHVRQILINLLSNAIKYTPPKGQVGLRLEKVGDKAKITVSDTGVGLSVEQQPHLFERFYRADDSYSRTQVGTGLGLALTKKLVELNGGKIGFSSEAGKGSVFWFLVPLAEGQSACNETAFAADAKVPTYENQLNGLNILIVDDNHSTCDVLQTIIRSAGGQPYVAYSVAEAKRIVEHTSLDTVLVDLAIPGESGISLLDYFRKDCPQPLSKIPLIVVTACVFDTDRQDAMQHGASQFIAKPFSPLKIVSAIRELTTAAVMENA